MQMKSTTLLAVLTPFLISFLLTQSPAIAAIAAPILLSPASVGSAAYDFGKVNQGSTAPLLHQFFLKNDNADPVVVQRVQVSCGWLGFVRGAPRAMMVPLALGETLRTIRTTVIR